MNILTYGAEDRNETFPKFDEVSGTITFETANPLYGNSSLKFDQSSTQYLGKTFPYTPVTNSWQGFHFKATAIGACGLVQWLTGTTSRGDLRFNASSRKLEARVNGTLVTTSAKIFNADTLYHLELFLTINASYQHIQVKINDKPLFVLNYFANSGASPANYDTFRWGPFLGGGSGTLLMDDILLNDASPETGGDYSWPGRIAITDGWPSGHGALIVNQFGAVGAPSLPEAANELNHDGDTTFGHTNITHRRHAITFDSPSQPLGGIQIEAVGFDVVTRVTTLAEGSEEPEGSVKVRFRGPDILLDDVQTLRLTDAEAGDTFQFSYEDVSSPVLDYDASLADVQAEADIIFGELGCVVTGTPGEEYVFTFTQHWSQTRMLSMQASGTFASGSIEVERSSQGDGIYEAGEPFGYVPPLSELPDDALTDLYPEPLTTDYENRSARRRTALDGGSWSRSKADAVELVLRSKLPLLVEELNEELPPPGAVEGSAEVNDGEINGFDLNSGPGQEGTGIPEPDPPEPPPYINPAYFQGNSTWYTEIPGSPTISANSANYVAFLVSVRSSLALSLSEWSVPVFYATGSDPVVDFTATDSSVLAQSAMNLNGWKLDIPLPAAARPAGYAATLAGQYRDGHMVIISPDGDYCWDFFRARPDLLRTVRVKKWDLSTSGLAQPFVNDTNGSNCRVAPVPLLHGLVTYDEIQAGVIEHAIAYAVYAARTGSPGVYPCVGPNSGQSGHTYAPWLGMRFQLNPSVNIDALGLSAPARVIAQALQTYGMIFVENNGPGESGIYLENLDYNPNRSWSGILNSGSISAVPVNQFRLIDPLIP